MFFMFIQHFPVTLFPSLIHFQGEGRGYLGNQSRQFGKRKHITYVIFAYRNIHFKVLVQAKSDIDQCICEIQVNYLEGYPIGCRQNYIKLINDINLTNVLKDYLRSKTCVCVSSVLSYNQIKKHIFTNIRIRELCSEKIIFKIQYR